MRKIAAAPRKKYTRTADRKIRSEDLAWKDAWPGNCTSAGGRKAYMDAVVIAATLLGSFAGAFVLQKAALEGLFRAMQAGRRDPR
jgi:hypothetical protein